MTKVKKFEKVVEWEENYDEGIFMKLWVVSLTFNLFAFVWLLFQYDNINGVFLVILPILISIGIKITDKKRIVYWREIK